jgi:hypothetical protein
MGFLPESVLLFAPSKPDWDWFVNIAAAVPRTQRSA